jgi:hypothetical protein
MAAYKTVASLPPTEAAYIAGLIDGEGTIALSRRHRSDERQLVISISNTERPLLEYVSQTLGAGRITTKKTYKPAHSRSFTFTIDNRQALCVLQQIAPYLKTYKAARAQLVLKEYVSLTPRNGRYTNEMRLRRESFVNQFLSILPIRTASI